MNYYYAAALIIAAGTSAAIAFVAWRRRAAPGASGLMFYMLADVVWAATYAVRWMVAEPAAQLFWLDATYFGVVSNIPFLLICILQFTGRSQLLTRRNLALLAIVPLATLLILWTDAWHGLFFGGQHSTGSILSGGPWFWFFVLFSYTQIFVLIVLLGQAYLRASSLYRRQAGSLLFAASLPVVGNILSLAGFSPFPNLDVTPFIFTLSGLIYAYAFFGLGVMDVVPVARHKLVDEMADGVIVLDANRRIVDVNPAVLGLIGISAAVIGKPCGDILNALLHLDQAGDPKAASLMDLRVSENPVRDIELQILPLLDHHQNITGQLLILHDITERKRLKEYLQQQAITDELTGIFNRRHFQHLALTEMKRAVRLKHPLAIVLIDIDYFKHVNDTLGHAAGDQVLIAFTKTCQKNIREIDVLARFGGDEFALLLSETNREQAYTVAERIRAAITAQQIDLDGVPIAVTISSGFANLSVEEDTFDKLLSRADQALYRAKEAGRNKVVEY